MDLMIWPDQPALSWLVLVLVAVVLLYGARRAVHGLVLAVSRALSGALRIGSRTLLASADRMQARNTEVLLALGERETRRSIEREFQRIGAIVERDLAGYPALQRQMLEHLTKMEEDYQKAGTVEPPPPDWLEAVQSIAKIKTGSELAQQLLAQIAESIEAIYEKILAEYRRANEERHAILKGLIPFGRSLTDTLGRVDQNIGNLQNTARQIDGYMTKYEQIASRSDVAIHALTTSALTTFITSALVLAVAFGGAFVNFWLIARPMAAMVGGGAYVAGGLDAAQVAALVIILIEAAMGLFLLEALGITRMFPAIHHLGPRLRKLLLWVSFSILFILAGIEVALALMRDQLIAADLMLKRDLAGATAAAAQAPVHDWVLAIPLAGQMILGFVLPFALAFVGVPLENFMHSGRSVMGVLAVAAVRGTGAALRMLAHGSKHLGNALTLAYDAVVCVPLMIERGVLALAARAPRPTLPAPATLSTTMNATLTGKEVK